MDHQEAVSLEATEQYLLGMLDEDQREAFEEHFFVCLECAEDVRAGMAVVAVARWLPDTRPDALPQGSDVTLQTPRIAAARAPEAAQVAEAAVAQAVRDAELPAAREVPTSRAASRAHRRWFGAPQVRSYALALSGLAAGLCIAAYQGIFVIPDLRDQVQRAEGLQAVPSYFLTLSRSEAPVITVSPDDRQVALTLSRSWDRALSVYRVALHDASGRTVFSETLRSLRAAQGDELEVLLPVRRLAAGSYVLVVEGVDGGPGGGAAAGPVPAARYSFHLQRR
jgi:hypothetical protein